MIFQTSKKMMDIYCFKKTIWWDVVLQFLVAAVTNLVVKTADLFPGRFGGQKLEISFAVKTKM